MTDIPFEQILRALRQAPADAVRAELSGDFPGLDVNDDWSDRLREWKLDRFESLWDLPRDWIESPNERRGGWSGVTRIEPAPGTVLYVKRQANQRRRSPLHPFGAPTLAFENTMYRFVCRRAGPADPPVLYGHRHEHGELQAVLVTRALDGKLRDLNGFFDALRGDENRLRETLRQISPQLLALHRLGVQHGAFFAPHIWLSPETGELKLIDWERGRFRLSPRRAALEDFRQLIRRTGWLTETTLGDLLDAYRGPLEGVRRQILEEFRQRRTQS